MFSLEMLLRTLAKETLSDSSEELFQEVRDESGYTGDFTGAGGTCS